MHKRTHAHTHTFTHSHTHTLAPSHPHTLTHSHTQTLTNALQDLTDHEGAELHRGDVAIRVGVSVCVCV